MVTKTKLQAVSELPIWDREGVCGVEFDAWVPMFLHKLQGEEQSFNPISLPTFFRPCDSLSDSPFKAEAGRRTHRIRLFERSRGVNYREPAHQEKSRIGQQMKVWLSVSHLMCNGSRHWLRRGVRVSQLITRIIRRLIPVRSTFA
jgi:hypothetical protein